MTGRVNRKRNRWLLGVFGALIVLAVAGALVVVPSLALKAVDRTYDALTTAQAAELGRSAHDAWRDRDEQPGHAELAAFLATHSEAGLSYVAIMGRGGVVEVEAGQASQAPIAGRMPPGTVEDLGSIIRAVIPLHPNGGGPPGLRRGRGGPPGRGPHDRPGPPAPGLGRDGPPRYSSSAPPSTAGPGPPMRLLLEYAPVTAQALREEAVRARWVGVGAATALVLLGLMLFGLLRQRTHLERRIATERHLKALGEMSSVLAHEIRNPLASLKGHAQLLEEMLENNARQAKKAGRVVAEAVRLEELTNALLDFARMAEARRESVDVARLIRQAGEATGTERLAFRLDEAPERWSLDPLRVRQALENVLKNAVEAAPDGPPAMVSARREGASLVICVDDNGPGIAAEDLARIFEPFHTGKTRGTGLGLAVARRVCEQHGGSISASNRAGGGARFVLTIPGA